MIRGDFVTISVQGDYGKPRPALVTQADQFGGHDSVTALLMSGTIIDALLIRVTVYPDASNSLQKPSQIMIDKAMTIRVRAARCGVWLH